MIVIGIHTAVGKEAEEEGKEFICFSEDHNRVDLEPEVIGDSRYRYGENGTFVGFYFPILGYEEYGIRIVSSKHIINGDVPETMCKFLDPVISFHIEAQVQTVVIRDAELVTIAVKYVF